MGEDKGTMTPLAPLALKRSGAIRVPLSASRHDTALARWSRQSPSGGIRELIGMRGVAEFEGTGANANSLRWPPSPSRRKNKVVRPPQALSTRSECKLGACRFKRDWHPQDPESCDWVSAFQEMP
jgi:hypothetical protein